jgi:carbonic anhydrase
MADDVEAKLAARTQITAFEALTLLRQGNARFAAGTCCHPNLNSERRIELIAAQLPFAAILGCSDSRVAPELIFDRGLGDLFSVRNGGNLAGRIAIESLAFAVASWHVPLIMVLGHLRCGAIAAALQSSDSDPDSLLGLLAPSIEAARPLPGDLATNAVRENVKRFVTKVRTSIEIQDAAAGHPLTIMGAIYDSTSGFIEEVP